MIAALAALALAAQEPVDFSRDVAPVLERRCLPCHNPGTRKGELSLATAEDLDFRALLRAVSPGPGGRKPKMPKEGDALDAAQVELLRRWIAEGARWPAGLVLRERSKADKSWWSLRPLSRAEPPCPPGLPEAWRANPVDRFVFAALAEKGLRPSAPADRRTLLRRVTYGLTGLPPSPEEIAAFEKDAAPDAYERVVDRLLASPAYGEHWGRHWLDVVRFGESTGYERNVILDNAWPFRDYVLRSFNEDKPFDRLVLEHLAGDVVGNGDPAVEIGTGFLVGGPYDNVGNQDAAQAARIRADTLDDVIRATGEAFLGVTIGCARCHNHKFDPILQEDYYRLYATFAGVQHASRTAAGPDARRAREAALAGIARRRADLAATRAAIEDAAVGRAEVAALELPSMDEALQRLKDEETALPPLPSWWMGEFRPADGPFRLFVGGDPQRKGDPVAMGSPSFLENATRPYRLEPKAPEAERRLALARWITAPDNPLTPRVLANRIWQNHFGTGIVDTPSDFGFMGGRPTHPALLDWLALRLLEGGWRLKAMHRLIVTSQAYRQSGAYREDAARVDGDSRLLWRFPPRRLSGEELRDTMLAVAGKLEGPRGGPGFRLYRYVQDNVATYLPLDRHGPETYRRSVYHQNARAARVDVLTDFDCPDCAVSAPRRASTTTPMQALTLLNHSFTSDMAGFLAERLRRDAGPGPEAQVDRAFALAYGRAPSPEERTEAAGFVRSQGLKAFARVILNTNELIFLE